MQTFCLHGWLVEPHLRERKEGSPRSTGHVASIRYVLYWGGRGEGGREERGGPGFLPLSPSNNTISSRQEGTVQSLTELNLRSPEAMYLVPLSSYKKV